MRAGSEIDTQAMHEYVDFHPRIQAAPATFSRTLQSLCLHTCTPGLLPSTSPPLDTKERAYCVPSACIPSNSFNKSQLPAKPVLGKDLGVVKEESGQKRQRRWSAGAAERRGRNMTALLMLRPASAMHTPTAAELATTNHLQLVVIGVHGKQGVGFCGKRAEVWQGSEQESARFS
jgi:hypothetical protein